MNSNALQKMLCWTGMAALMTGCAGASLDDEAAFDGSGPDASAGKAQAALSGAAACNTDPYDFTFLNMPDTYAGNTDFTWNDYGWRHPNCPDTYILDVVRGNGANHNNAYARFSWDDTTARTKAECEAHAVMGYGRIETSPGVWTDTGGGRTPGRWVNNACAEPSATYTMDAAGDDSTHYRVFFAATFNATSVFPKAAMKMQFRVKPF
jgi:hypothetical protein